MKEKTIDPSSFSTKEKIAQSFSIAAFVNDSNNGIKRIEKLITDYTIGGLTFFHSKASTVTNFDRKKQVVRNEQSLHKLTELIKHYQNIASYPLLISIDAEWGLAMRIENAPQYPYSITLGAIPNHKLPLIYEIGKQIGNDLASVGIHLNLAPVVDINTNPNNPVIGYRSFGENKEKVTHQSIAFYKGLKDAGVLGCFKHFPGHGDTAIDSHLGLPILTKTKKELYDQELYPFIQGIKEGVDCILMGHLAIPCLTHQKNVPATLSKEIIQDLLRKELGFEGVVISDALNMRSVSKLYPKKGMLEWKAYDAGNDILCFPEHPEEGIEYIEKMATSHQINESFNRIIAFKKNALATSNKTNVIDQKKSTTINLNIAKASITHYKVNTNYSKQCIEDKCIAIHIGTADDCSIFFNKIEKTKTLQKIDYNDLDVSEYHAQNILIALFVPSVKPKNEFGIDQKIKNDIAKLSLKNNVFLYLFGNPYALTVLKTQHINNIALAYQKSISFQEIAAQHFLGKHIAIGEVPVQL